MSDPLVARFDALTARLERLRRQVVDRLEAHERARRHAEHATDASLAVLRVVVLESERVLAGGGREDA